MLNVNYQETKDALFTVPAFLPKVWSHVTAPFIPIRWRHPVDYRLYRPDAGHTEKTAEMGTKVSDGPGGLHSGTWGREGEGEEAF